MQEETFVIISAIVLHSSVIDGYRKETIILKNSYIKRDTSNLDSTLRIKQKDEKHGSALSIDPFTLCVSTQTKHD